MLVYFQKSLENAEYGGDVDTVQSLAEEHEQFHQEVLSFRKEVERCIADGVRGPVDCIYVNIHFHFAKSWRIFNES